MNDDPMGEGQPSSAGIKKARQSLPMCIDIVMEDPETGGPFEMTVLTSNGKATDKVGIQIKRENFEWLYKSANIGAYTPKVRKSSSSKPQMAPVEESCPDVKWSEAKKALWVRYKDAAGKEKTVSRRVQDCSDDERNDKMFVDTAITLQALKDAEMMKAEEKPPANAACSKRR